MCPLVDWVRSVAGSRAAFTDSAAHESGAVCARDSPPRASAVVREKCSEALHFLDRFHIVAKMNKAHRAHEEHRAVAPPAPRADPQLLRRSGAAFQGSRNRPTNSSDEPTFQCFDFQLLLGRATAYISAAMRSNSASWSWPIAYRSKWLLSGRYEKCGSAPRRFNTASNLCAAPSR